MIKRSAFIAVIGLAIISAGARASGGVGFSSVPDTIGVALHQLIEIDDADGFGPDFEISGDSIWFDDSGPSLFSGILGSFTIPFRGKVISKYGIRRGRMHTGTDIKLAAGDTVFAAYDGVVTRATRYYGYGNLVIISHPQDLETYYAHLSGFLVTVGDTILRGQPLGLGGRTGRATTEHLHFEIREKGKAYNPELVLDFENFTVRDEIVGKEALAEVVASSPAGVSSGVTSRGNSYVMESPAGQLMEYVIKGGDSLWVIARRFNTSVARLCELNNLTTRSVLRIGAVIQVFHPSE